MPADNLDSSALELPSRVTLDCVRWAITHLKERSPWTNSHFLLALSLLSASVDLAVQETSLRWMCALVVAFFT